MNIYDDSLEIGDKIDIKIKLDDMSYYQKLTISYLIDNIIITCGHCLPSNAIIDNGEIIYTSGFDTPDEGNEIGFIKINKAKFITKYKLVRTDRLINLFNSLKISNQIMLLHQKIVYKLNNLKIYTKYDFEKIKLFKLNHIIDDIYFMHTINKIIPTQNSKIFTELFDISHVGLAYSTEKSKPLKDDNKYICNIVSKYGLDIKTDKIYYITEPSFSGSPIIMHNYVIGYHIGSTYGFKINTKLNQIDKIYKIIYYKLFLLKS